MHPYDGQQPVTARRRRAARNADSYMNEPSMSAPQHMPPARNASARPAMQQSAPQQPLGQMQPMAPVQTMAPAPPGSMGYSGQMRPAGQRNGNPSQSAGMYAQGIPGSIPNQVQPSQSAYQGAYRQQSYGSYGQQYQQTYGWQEQPAQSRSRDAWQQSAYSAQQNWQGYEQQESAYAANGGYVPPTPPVQGKSSGSGGSQPPRNIGKILIGLLALAAVFVVIALVSSGNRQVQQNNDVNKVVAYYENRYCEGVHVNGIHLGGMTHAEANQAVSDSVRQQLDNWKVRLTLDGMLAMEIKAADLGMTIDVQSALNEAWAQGHTATDAAGRKTEMDLLQLSHFHTMTAAATFDAARVDAILADLASRVYRAPVDGYLKEFNPQLTYPFVVEEGQNGAELNVAAAREEILSLANGMESGSVALEVMVIPATIQTGASEIVLRGSAYTAISTTSTVERTANIKRAFELITGTVLKPGESFSFNNIVGARNAKNGFFQAIEYAYGSERMGYGGGVCQASTTLYLAAVRANLEIVKREQHSDKVNYTDYGLDATVNLDGKKIDFVFRNNTENDIYIVASVQLDRKIDKKHYIAKVDIYGEPLGDGVTYDLVAETVEVIPPPVDPEFKEDEDAQYVVFIDEEKVVRKASEGYVVETFKVQYVNGVEMDRTYMYRDTYKAKPELVYVGVSERP